jgi:predicted permease
MDKQTVEIINRVLPILFLLFLGFWVRRSRFLSESQVEGLKKLVVNLGLPSLLFLSFLQIDLKPSFLVVSLVIFLLSVALYILGRLLNPIVAPEYVYFPFVMTGFEYGMLGISLFASAYTLKNIHYIAVIDLGQEIFIWFVFLPLLLMKRDSIQRPSELLFSITKSPVVIGILAGILLNFIGVGDSLADWPVTGAMITTMQFLADMTVPLILLVVGFGIKLDSEGFGSATRVILIRLGILIPTALLLNRLLIRGLLELGKPYEVALFTLLILPPPFIIPLFMRQDMLQERRYVNNVLALYTLASIVVFIIYFILNPIL